MAAPDAEMAEVRDHDAQYADRADLTDKGAQRLGELAQRHHEFKQHLWLKHPQMREKLKLLHMLSEHVEVDSELLGWVVRECQRAPHNSISATYNQEAFNLGKERYNKAVNDLKDTLSRCINPAQVDVQQTKLERLEAAGPTPALDPTLGKIIEIIASEGVTKSVQGRVLVLSNRHKQIFDSLCMKHNKPIPNEDQRRAMRLLQYAQVKEEFKFEDDNNVAIPTRMIWAWFRGERRQRVDGRAFWDVYAKLCGYVDDKGDPLPPNLDKEGNKLPKGKAAFHCDHVLCRKGHRTSSSDGSQEPCYEVDHWSNYAIHWAAINTDSAMWDDVPDVISDLKYWLHGEEACRAIEQSVAHRAQRLAANRKHTTKLLENLGHTKDTQKALYAWVPSDKHDVMVGRVVLSISGSRKRVDRTVVPAAAAQTNGKGKKKAKALPPGQLQLGFAAEDPSSPDAGASSSNETTDTAVAGPSSSSTPPPGSPEAEEEKTSDIGGVSWRKDKNKWRVQTTMKGIHPKNDNGEWTVWQNKSLKHVGYYASKAEAEAARAPEQEARGKQWCREVEATKNLPYLPWCRSRVEPPDDWVSGKQYATIYFGARGGLVGPVVVSIVKDRIYTDKDGVKRQVWMTRVSKTFRRVAEEEEEEEEAEEEEAEEEEEEGAWMDAFPAEYRAQPGLEQTAEAFAQQKALDERGYVRKYAQGKHDAGQCNAINADGDYCETMCGRTDGKLHRCMSHGGPEMRGKCVSAFLSDAGRAPNTCKETGPTNNGLSSHKGEHWCGRCCNDSCAANVAKAIWEYKKKGVAFPNGFVELARKRTSDSSFDF